MTNEVYETSKNGGYMFETKHTTKFPGFSGPNYTQVPDALFDELLPDLSGAELKVLLYIVRRTFGFKRDSDHISLSQMLNGIRARDGRVLDRGVGLSKKTLLAAINSLEDKHIVFTQRRRSIERGDEPTTYRLNVIEDTRGAKTPLPVGEKLHQGGGVESTPGPWGRNYTTQETVLQETVQQQTGISSNPSKASTMTDEELDQREEPQQGRRRQHSEPTPVGQLLAQRFATADSLRRTVPAVADSETTITGERHATAIVAPDTAANSGAPPVAPTPQQLDAAIEEVSQSLGDWYHRKSNKSQAHNILQESGLSEGALTQLAYEELANVDDRSNSRTQPAIKNLMAYFFECLRTRVTDYQPHRLTDTGELEHEEPEAMTWQSLPPDTDPTLLWDTVLGALKNQVTRPIFETYLRETGAPRNVDGRLVVSAPSHAADWLDTKLRPLILQTVANIVGGLTAVTFTNNDSHTDRG